jgi:hypothetical protein
MSATDGPSATPEQILADWTQRLQAELGHPELEVDIAAILNLAGEAAHAVIRPAAPLTTFLVGYAAGIAAAAGAGTDSAVRDATEVALRACRHGATP